jgi:prepilin-type N-terminal cleavage/methylation domain-containing protein
MSIPPCRSSTRTHAPDRGASRAYTLVELLIVITILGIAAAMVVPSMGSTDVLRVQGAIRTLVADIAEAQSDAIAFQKGRAIVFFPDEHRYIVAEVNGPMIDIVLDKLVERRLNIDLFGYTRITGLTFENDMLVFDEMGGPVTAPQSSNPAPEGWVELTGTHDTYRVIVEAYTGRTMVQRAGSPGGG